MAWRLELLKSLEKSRVCAKPANFHHRLTETSKIFPRIDATPLEVTRKFRIETREDPLVTNTFTVTGTVSFTIWIMVRAQPRGDGYAVGVMVMPGYTPMDYGACSKSQQAFILSRIASARAGFLA